MGDIFDHRTTAYLHEKLTEDLHDLAIVGERRDEEPISLEEMKRRLKQDGLL